MTSVGAATSRREQLLDAAEACFARRGFHATTVADISAAAGCSPGLLYRYFAGKDDLVAALVARDAQRYVAWLHGIRAAPDPMAAMRELLDRALGEADPDADCGMALDLEVTAEAARNPALAAVVRRATDELLAAIVEVLRAGQATGAFDRRLDPHVTARVLFAVVDGLGAQGALDPTYRPSAQAGAVGDLLEHLLAPRHDDPRSDRGPDRRGADARGTGKTGERGTT